MDTEVEVSKQKEEDPKGQVECPVIIIDTAETTEVAEATSHVEELNETHESYNADDIKTNDQGISKKNDVLPGRDHEQLINSNNLVKISHEDTSNYPKSTRNNPSIDCSRGEPSDVLSDGEANKACTEESPDSIEIEMLHFLDHSFSRKEILLGVVDFARLFILDYKCDKRMQIERLKAAIRARRTNLKNLCIKGDCLNNKNELILKYSEILEKLLGREISKIETQTGDDSENQCKQVGECVASNSSTVAEKGDEEETIIDDKILNDLSNTDTSEATNSDGVPQMDVIQPQETLNIIAGKYGNDTEEETIGSKHEKEQTIESNVVNTGSCLEGKPLYNENCIEGSDNDKKLKGEQDISENSDKGILLSDFAEGGQVGLEEEKELQTSVHNSYLETILMDLECPFKWKPNDAIKIFPTSRNQENIVEYLTDKEKKFARARRNLIREIAIYLVVVYEKARCNQISGAAKDLQHCYKILAIELTNVALKDPKGECTSLTQDAAQPLAIEDQAAALERPSTVTVMSNERVVETSESEDGINEELVNSSKDLPMSVTKSDLNEEHTGNDQQLQDTSNEHEKVEPVHNEVESADECNDGRTSITSGPTEIALNASETQTDTVGEDSNSELRQETITKLEDCTKTEMIMNGTTYTSSDGKSESDSGEDLNINQIQNLQPDSQMEAEIKDELDGVSSELRSCNTDHNVDSIHDKEVGHTKQDLEQESNTELKTVSTAEESVEVKNEDDNNNANIKCIEKGSDNINMVANEDMYQWPEETEFIDCFASCNMGKVDKPKARPWKDLNDIGDAEHKELRHEVGSSSCKTGEVELNGLSEEEKAKHRDRLAALQYIIKACLVYIAYYSGEIDDALAVAQELHNVYNTFGPVSKATVLAIKGLLLCEYGNVGNKLALPILLEALKLDPCHWEWNLYCGKVMGRVRRVEKNCGAEPDQQEVELLEKAVSLHRRDAASMVYLANIYRTLSSIKYRQATQEQIAATCSSEPYLQSCLQGSWRNSRSSKYQNICNSKDSQRWQPTPRPRNLDSPYLRLAKKLYLDALELEPHCPYNNARCAKGLWSMPYPFKDNTRAQQAIVHAQALAHDDTLVNHYSGMFYEQRRDFAKALECYERAIRGNNNYPAEMSYINLRLKMSAPGSYSPIFHLDSLMNKYTTPSYILQTHCMRAFYLFKVEKQTLKAICYFCKAIKLDPGNTSLKIFYPGMFYGRYPYAYNIYELLESLLEEIKNSKTYKENRVCVEDAWQVLNNAREHLRRDELAVLELTE